MQPKTITLTGSGAGTTNSDPYRTDWRNSDISLSFNTSGSTTGFTAQYTMTPPDGYASATAWASGATWHNADTINAATAKAAESIVGPVQGVRLQANATGTDTGTLIVTQNWN